VIKVDSRFGLNADGSIGPCEAKEENIGRGRCHHGEHVHGDRQTAMKAAEEFNELEFKMSEVQKRIDQNNTYLEYVAKPQLTKEEASKSFLAHQQLVKDSKEMHGLQNELEHLRKKYSAEGLSEMEKAPLLFEKTKRKTEITKKKITIKERISSIAINGATAAALRMNPKVALTTPSFLVAGVALAKAANILPH